LPLSAAEHVDQVCDAFESAWKNADAGPRPALEDYLGNVPEPERSVLLRELLLVELAYRARHGDNPSPEEYRRRFPEHGELIGGVFRQGGPVAAAGDVESEATTLPPAPPRATHWPDVPGYDILEELEAGGMGLVYKALHLRFNLVVALKMIRTGQAAGLQELARFHVEAQAVASLHHPHIVRIFDYGEHNGLPYFSMEFLDGGSLAKKLDGKPLPVPQAAQLVETLARAMHVVHQRGLIHRDLKPANVLLSADGTPRIADFGLAKKLDEDPGRTRPGSVMGTASYMAPEQAAGKTREVGKPADVYSLGAILYETLTGRPPFRAETRELTINQVLNDEPVSPSHWQPGVPPVLEAICLKCLEKEPRGRYAGAEVLAEDLRCFQAGEPISIEPLDEVKRQVPWARRAGYEILDLTSASVLGMMFKARHIGLNQLRLLKTISARAQTEPAMLARFRAEAEAAAQLQHPNIVQIYDFGEQSGQAYFSLEYLDGGTLADRCRGTPVPPRQAAQLVETLARAAHFAHEKGIVHTDLRPFNVHLTAAGVPKITGFGLARLLEKQPGAGDKRVPRGLSNYMAPEQAGPRTEDISPATDVHALGAMLYEMLTGRPPFLADTVRETLEKIRAAEPAPPSHWQPDVPALLETLCLKCLQKDPRKRYPSAEELADDLHRFLVADQPETYPEIELIPGYEILEELGRGGIGVVSRARQTGLDRVVALKIIRNRLARCLAANRAVARVQHPNIVQVYDSGQREDFLYVAEEFVEGTGLDRMIAGRPQPPREAAALVETLARAVHYVHEQGIIHRNLKPSVVLLTPKGVPKISSFDLAKLLGRPEDQAEGQIVGTPVYMAPEQAAGKIADIGPATDVHGLGVILYEMLTGRPPFQSDAPLELLAQIRAQEPAPPSRLRPDVPTDLEAVCLKCLRKEPVRRYPSAAALADDLRRFLDGRRRGVWEQFVEWLNPRPRKPIAPR
jgi:serine/threonine protein kinase